LPIDDVVQGAVTHGWLNYYRLIFELISLGECKCTYFQ